MSIQISIYLAGKIKKGHEISDESYWKDSELKYIEQELSAYEVSFLNPAIRSDDLSIQKSVFGRDMLQVLSADFVFVDARSRRGLGVGAEMMWAKLNKVPVISLSPINSHYYLSETVLLDKTVRNWRHPFVESLSDCVVENIKEGCKWIKLYLKKPSLIKDVSYIKETMQYYKENQLAGDTPMINLSESNANIKKRVSSLTRIQVEEF